MFKSKFSEATNAEQFKALIEATSDVIYSMNPDWTEMYELKGKGFVVDIENPDQSWIDKYVYSEDQQDVLDKIQHAIESKASFEMEHRVKKLDGSTGWVHCRAVPILSADNEIVEWFGTASDITQRKSIELTLQETKEAVERQKRLYETITSNTPDLIYVFDKDYRFTYANQALLTMWGKSWEDSIGKGLLENGYEPWHAQMHEREIDEVIKTKQPIRGFVSFPHATQGNRIYDYIFVPVLDEEGEVEAIAGTTRDITELKKAIDESRESEARLQQKVEERTLALQRSNEELEQFAHVASHDMKEPLRKIGLFSTILRDRFSSNLPEPAVAYVEKIEKSAERLYGMINNILHYSYIGGSNITNEAVDLNQLVEDIKKDLELIIEEKNAHISYDSLPVLEGSPILLQQLFYNLINNALKFSRPGVPLIITISAGATLEEETKNLKETSGAKFAKIVVADNGIGFDDKHAETIFKSFSRLNSKDQYDGTGLGLALCKRIVERHHGSIKAAGKPGSGAEFVLVLPEAKVPSGIA